MKNNPRITVLMPVYNGEGFLREAIKSILNQTHEDFEFLIINDASTDKSREIILSYDDPRIKLIDNKVNLGLTRSLNKGLKIASGKYIARMDADDISMSDRLEKQIEIIEKNPDIGLVTGWIEIIDENGKYKGFWEADRNNNTPEELFYTLTFQNCIAHSTVLFDKELVLGIGGYSESFKKSQDYELWTRLSKITKIFKIKEVVVRYRGHKINLEREVHRLTEEKISIGNLHGLLEDNVDDGILLSIKYNDLGVISLKNSLNILDNINKSIIEKALPTLNVEKLKKCGKNKKHLLLSRFFKKRLNLKYAKFVILLLLRKTMDLAVSNLVDQRRAKKILNNVTKVKNKINILFIVPSVGMGGAEKVNLDILTNIDKEKFELHFITTNKIQNLRLEEFKKHAHKIYSLPDLLSSNYNDFILGYVERAGIDILLVTNSHIGYKVMPRIKQKYPNIKLVDLIHGEGSSMQFSMPHISTPFDEFIDRRIVSSAHLKNYMVENYFIPTEKIAIIRNGINLSLYDNNYPSEGYRRKFGIRKSDYVISYLGRLSDEKRPNYVIKIANRIVNLDNKKRYKFLIAGRGYLFESLQKEIAKYDLTNNVFLIGEIKSVRQFLKDSDILLVTSAMEGIPLVILEAMRMEVPVISTKVGGIPEIIEDGIDGYLIDNEYGEETVISEFSKKIELLATDQKKYTSITNKAKEKIVNEYSVKKMVTSYENIFLELMKSSSYK